MASKILFIGARGVFNKMPFEVLGCGHVGYTVKQVGDRNNSDDIGSTFPAVEYYCLANNGQTWYFAMSDNELYYCRQLDEKEVSELKTKANFEEKLSPNSFFNGNYKAILVEYGFGKLSKAEGRAIKDLYNFDQFEYYDFKCENKHYSVDIFPNKSVEWFETVWIPNAQLTEIFKDSLRLNNSKVADILKTAKLWRNLIFLALFVAICIFAMAVNLELQKKQIFISQREISSEKNSVIAFDPISINKVNQLYSLKIDVNLPKDQGTSLTFSLNDKNNKLISSSIQEFKNSSGSEDSYTSVFYPKEKVEYIPVFKVNDYGKIGDTATVLVDKSNCNNQEETNSSSNSSLNTCSSNNSDKIIVSIKLFEGGVVWSQWTFAMVFCIIMAIFAWYQKNITEKSAWDNS